MLFWEKKSMIKLIRNNLKSHMMRNRLTTTIISMALGFIIFMMVSFRLQIENNKNMKLEKRGTLPMMSTADTTTLRPDLIEPIFLRNQHVLEDFSFITFEIIREDQASIQKALATDLARSKNYQMGVFGIQPRLFETTATSLIDVYLQNLELPIGEQLYTPRGKQGLVMIIGT